MRKKTGIIIFIAILMVSVFLVLKSMYIRRDVPGPGGTVEEKRNKEFKEVANIKPGMETETKPAEIIQENVSEKSIPEIAAEIMRTKDAEQRLKLRKRQNNPIYR